MTVDDKGSPDPVQVVFVSGGARDYCVFVVAGEHSGDALGGKLMSALNRRLKGRVRYLGVGGEAMEAAGLTSQFPLAEVAVMGPFAILKRLPPIVRRVYQTVDAAIAAEPDVVIIIDSPEFTHPIARRIRRQRPDIPIIDYVSPSVWAWRPGRAKRMRRYIDHVLALLPFEPAEHARLGGPPCTYVGHPLIERRAWLDALDPGPLARRLGLDAGKPVLVVLPGSRRSEVSRLMGPFGEAIRRLDARGPAFEVVIPAVRSVRADIEAGLATWPCAVHVIEGEEDKFRAFKLARAALAASGTVTLELALAGTPMVVAYKVDRLAALTLRRLLKVRSVVLANLVLEENAFPELLQEDCEPGKIADETERIMRDSPERARQLAALARIPAMLAFAGATPSETAAAIVHQFAESGRARTRN